MLCPLIPGADGSLWACSLPQHAMAGAPTLAGRPRHPPACPGTLRMGKLRAAFPKFLCVARRIRDVAVNNLHQLCQISYLTKRFHFRLYYIKPANARLQLEWPLALPPSNRHVCFDKSYPGIIPGSENEVAWLHFIPKELGAHSRHHTLALDGAPWPNHCNTETPTPPQAVKSVKI